MYDLLIVNGTVVTPTGSEPLDIAVNGETTYDIVGIAEFPDDQSMSAFSLALASLGNVRTTTMRAYNEREMAAIIAKAR